MLRVRVVTPSATSPDVLGRVGDDPTVANVVVLRACTQDGDGDLVMFDLARENADPVLLSLRALGLEDTADSAGWSTTARRRQVR